jgi:SAM-dependent methyltransferase
MLPLLYHTHHNQYLEDLPFWLELAKQANGQILELGCGTGRIMLPLIENGYQVTGLDLSAEMLVYLKSLAVKAGLPEPDVVQADLTSFQLDMQFPLILLPCNTYSTLNASQRQSALDCITQHLTPGGVFATSLPNPDWLSGLEDIDDVEVDTIFIHPETGNPVQASNEWIRTQDQVEIFWHYDHLLPDGQVERFSQATRHWLTSTEQYLEELQARGCKVKTHGDFEREPFSTELPFLIIEAVLEIPRYGSIEKASSLH